MTDQEDNERSFSNRVFTPEGRLSDVSKQKLWHCVRQNRDVRQCANRANCFFVASLEGADIVLWQANICLP